MELIELNEHPLRESHIVDNIDKLIFIFKHLDSTEAYFRVSFEDFLNSFEICIDELFLQTL